MPRSILLTPELLESSEWSTEGGRHCCETPFGLVFYDDADEEYRILYKGEEVLLVEEAGQMLMQTDARTLEGFVAQSEYDGTLDYLSDVLKRSWWLIACIYAAGWIVSAVGASRLWVGAFFLLYLWTVVFCEQKGRDLRGGLKALVISIGLYIAIILGSFLCFIGLALLWALMGLITFQELGVIYETGTIPHELFRGRAGY